MARTKEEKERINKKYMEEAMSCSPDVTQVTREMRRNLRKVLDKNTINIISEDTDTFIIEGKEE